MEKSRVESAEKYYTLMSEKNVEGVKKYLHPDVEFYSLVTLKGKAAVVEAIGGFMKVFNSLTVRAKFGAGDQAVIVYEVDIPGIAHDFPSAALLNFRDGLIVRIQLFFDGSRFIEKKKEVFSGT